jgi:hypothetical protein
MLKQLTKALKVLDTVRSNHTDLGAEDTEGRYACERIIEAAFQGKNATAYTADQFALYDLPGRDKAAKDLNRALKGVCEAIASLTIKEIPKAKELIEDQFFDIEFSDV